MVVGVKIIIIINNNNNNVASIEGAEEHAEETVGDSKRQGIAEAKREGDSRDRDRERSLYKFAAALLLGCCCKAAVWGC